MLLDNPDGTQTYYKTFGDKASETETLLLLHGIGTDHEMWKPQIEKY